MPLLEWLSGNFIAAALTASPTLYIFANAAHILSIGLLVGAIVPLDLRILGFFRSTPLDVLGPFLSRAAMVGVILSIASGVVLFSVNAAEYAGNRAFLIKLGILAMGIANAVAMHWNPGWRAALSAGGASISIRISAALSLVIWISVVVAGRWIGFL